MESNSCIQPGRIKNGCHTVVCSEGYLQASVPCQLMPIWYIIDPFYTTSRYLDNILNINNIYFESMVSQIYPSELQLINKRLVITLMIATDCMLGDQLNH